MKLHSQEIENAFIANMMLEGEIYKLNGTVTEEHFFFDENKKLFNAIQSLLDKKEPVSPVVLAEKTKVSMEHIVTLVEENVGQVFGIQSAYDLLEEYRVKRYAQELTRGFLNNFSSLEGEDVAEEVKKLSDSLTEGLTKKRTTFDINEDFKETLEDICSDENQGFRTGLNAYDDALNNIKHGEFHVIAGMPSVGKSAMALNMMLNMAKSGLGVVYFSVEEAKKNFIKRLYANQSGIPFQAFCNGLKPEQKQEVRQWLYRATGEGGDLYNVNMFIEDNVDTMPEIFNYSASYKYRKGLDVIIIDGATSITTKEKDMLSNYEYMAKQCLKIARQLDICVILLAHVNSESLRKDKETGAIKPNMTSVYGGQALVKLAFSCTVLTRDMEQKFMAGIPTEVKGHVIKARNAPPNQVMNFAFDGVRQQYLDSAM